MTADDRFNQLEPLLVETITILDRHTSQLKQLNNNVVQLNAAVIQQGDNITFLLREQLVMKADMAEMKADITGLKTDVTEIKGDITGLKTGQAETNSKLDQLLQLLQNPGK
ncbi:hypothetical protein [Hymenobacter sp. PAMC 26628]|uniref:hypothetical protein n=1 Tax=Hymenobacter sp. PAMC 26628 TaxID=1484118 RepID=UPI000770602B|nr:hypothetical protein [Hymenobacter sp. PAMC 26628]AMJ67026.1 hypothetical protein AXW84_17500 [Hymenobacter sp. PAMC 26628]